MSLLDVIFFWRTKTPSDNQWHPEPGAGPVKYVDNLPSWAKRADIDATAVDIAPFIAGVGGLAHIRQIHELGLTMPHSVFRNPKTMTAMHRAVLILAPLVLGCQAAGLEYRNFIPRWVHDRERQRDEGVVRQHIEAGMAFGLAVWTARIFVWGVGRRYWAPLDIVTGGAVADLMHREYNRTHDF